MKPPRDGFDAQWSLVQNIPKPAGDNFPARLTIIACVIIVETVQSSEAGQIDV
jgi:hypothetical protein